MKNQGVAYLTSQGRLGYCNRSLQPGERLKCNETAQPWFLRLRRTNTMPLILWLLGVPLTVVVLLYLLGVI
jgi:hypothetical protein